MPLPDHIGYADLYEVAPTSAIDRSGVRPLNQWMELLLSGSSAIVTDPRFGAVGDGTADDTAAIQAAIDTGSRVYLPTGIYKVTNILTLGNGQLMYGDGRTQSIIRAQSDFNLSALGVVRLGTGEPGATLLDIGILCIQPDSAVRGDYIHYPPAIYAVAAPRFQIDRVRISGAWNGLDATGNTGGAYIGRLEVGALNKGLLINGALDFWHADSLLFEFFGFTTANRLAVYSDQTTVAAEIGVVDGLSISKLSSFSARVDFTSAGSQIPGRDIGILQLDGDGARLTLDAGPLTIGQVYSTKTTPGTSDILQSGGTLRIGQFYSAGSNAASVVKVTGGNLLISGGSVWQTADNQAAFEVTAGQMLIDGVHMTPDAGVTRTVAYVLQTGGILGLRNCTFQDNAAGTGAAVSIAVDNIQNALVGNSFSDWTVTLPSGALLGIYGPNREPLRSFTPVITFATPGDFVPTYTVQQGRYRYVGGAVEFQIRLAFSSNAYTTASGGAKVTGLPVASQGISDIGYAAGTWSNINLSVNQWLLSGIITSGATEMQLMQSGDAVARAGLGPAGIPASTSGFEITFSGFIPTT